MKAQSQCDIAYGRTLVLFAEGGEEGVLTSLRKATNKSNFLPL